MNKYYRVRTPEQWDWLMKYFEKVDKGIRWNCTGKKPIEYNNWKKFKSNSYITLFGDVTLFYGDVERDKLSDFIEVSNLMEDKKMKYVTIKGKDIGSLECFDIRSTGYFSKKAGSYTLTINVDEGLKVPTSLLYPKIKMTKAEKDEFDKLKDEISLNRHDLDDLLTRIQDSEDFPLLYHRLYVADGDGVESQLEFACAWADPSLIEVIPEKRWNVKVPPFSRTNKYYYKFGGKLRWADGIGNDYEDQQFTDFELKKYGLDDDMYEKVEVKQ